MVPLLFAILVATFALLSLAPGDPARQVAGLRASEEQLEQVREHLGLDRPVWEQFGRYLGRLAHGDLGTTANGSAEVRELIQENAVPTLWLIGGSLVVTLVATAVLSVLAVRKPGGWFDVGVRGFSVAGLTMPPFWVGIVLLILVARPTGWFPIGGWADSTGDRIRAVALPALTMALVLTPTLVRSFRASLLEAAASDHVTAARSLGIDGWRLTRRYILRNAAPPSFALLVSLSGFLLSGTVVVETTFGIPGLGQTMIRSAIQRDFNMVQGLTLVFAVAVVVLNLVGDLALAALDPRIDLR
jgi:peptide/nickel transport system permease protein